MNILLVYPEMPYAFWSMSNLLRISGKRASYPPIGLLTVAAMLPKEWHKRLIDLNLNKLADEDLKWADYVFIGAMNVQATAARALIRRCKLAGVKVVAGGPLFTHEYAAFPGVDHFVLNEAEVTLPRFLADLAEGCPKPIYTSPEMADVHTTPVPLWELVDLSQYGFAIVQYSRGCPYQCDFCDVTALFGRRPRTKTSAQIIAELEALGDLDRFDLVVFADDNLIGNKKLLKTDLLPALIEWRRQKQPAVGFATQLTVNLADDPELMQLMLDAGFRHIFVGVETPDEDSLIACKKRQNTRRDLLDSIRQLHRSGFIVTAGFIVGFDTDTAAIFQRQIDFIQDCGIVIAGVSVLKAPPGTELYDRMKREGRLIYEFDFHESQTNIVPKMDARTLSAGYKQILTHLCAPEHVFERATAFMRDYRTQYLGQLPLTAPWNLTLVRRYLGIIWRIIYSVGLRGPQRAHFWRLIRWTAVNRRDLIDLAFFFGVWMYELQAMYKSYDASGHFDIYKVPMALAERTETAAISGVASLSPS